MQTEQSVVTSGEMQANTYLAPEKGPTIDQPNDPSQVQLAMGLLELLIRIWETMDYSKAAALPKGPH